MVFDGSYETHDWDDEKEDPTGDDAPHDSEGCDDCDGFAICCGPDQDKCYKLKNKIITVWQVCVILI